MSKQALELHHNAKIIRLGSMLQRFYFRPTFIGAEHIDAQRPAMYVGNHTIYGVFDSPILIDYLFTQHKIVLVSLGDHVHFKVPLWKNLVKGMGAVDGLKETARLAMQQGYSILVFPGGGREVSKRKGEAYTLMWKQRYGFLKLAQEFDYQISPFVALGGDDIYELAVDANSFLKQKWFQVLLKLPKVDQLLRHGEMIPAIPKHIVPKRVPFYFEFFPCLTVPKTDDPEQLQQFRDQLQAQIYAGIAQLQLHREQQH